MVSVLFLQQQSSIPSWLQNPVWLRPLAHAVRLFIVDHQAFGLFGVVFSEELGVPLPAPGDVAIAYGGYLTTTGAIPLAGAYVAVVAGAVLGSLCLFTISRRYGHRFLVRAGRYIGLDRGRLDRAEKAFRRWGPWAIIIGRHIPGFRIVLSAFAGAFNVPYRIFVPSVFVSSVAWAAIFINVGRYLGPQSRFLFRLIPLHLLPPVIFSIAALAAVILAYEHGYRPLRTAQRERERQAAIPREAGSTEPGGPS